jgi:hypothetical protein
LDPDPNLQTISDPADPDSDPYPQHYTPELQKVSRNKIIGDEFVWREEYVIQLNRSLIKAIWDKNLTKQKNDEKECQRSDCCRRRCLESLVAKPPMQFTS